MLMTGTLFRRALHAVFASGLGIIMATATPTGVSTMPSMSAVATVPEHMHRDHPGKEQHPNPVLRKPFHDFFLFTELTCRLAVCLIDVVSSHRYVSESFTPVCRKDLVDADRSSFELRRAASHIQPPHAIGCFAYIRKCLFPLCL